MISKDEVQHIAKLARLGLTEEEVGRFQKELSAILDYIGKLKEADVSGVEPTSHSVLIENIMRKDNSSGADTEIRKKIIKQFPEGDKDYLKVRSIIKLPFMEAKIWN
jgi:aspartyl-tRNA(Asn)/glutamyl-tRNA(Gln) amidotransferase subunit C